MNRDLQLLTEIVDVFIPESEESFLQEAFGDKPRNIDHPLDKDIREKLDKIKQSIRDTDDDYRVFYYSEEIKDIWKLVIQKSIKCLRFFDTREPFLSNDSKHPVAYGVDELSDYFEKYIKFESMLYGGGKYYRDHVIHVFRVWLLGLECLLDSKADYLERIKIQKNIEVNKFEKISIWSIIALTHDLGYPLEKAQGIIDQTKEMMKSFVANPSVSLDLSFNGIQNNMNDYVIRFMSSKMHFYDNKCPQSTDSKNDIQYVARLQPKYYFKFQKSLERYNHGILSSIIIYKLLRYFLESDFSINEDYRFDSEEARQFYIRREILRTISSHTCHDIYHLDMLNFAFLLIVVDDAQEWGRKRISELYVNKGIEYELESITPIFDEKEYQRGDEIIKIHAMEVKEKFTFTNEKDLEITLRNLFKQGKDYKEIFRDGQDTTRRNFIFKKTSQITLDQKTKKIEFEVELNISNEESPSFFITVSANKNNLLGDYNKSNLEKIFDEIAVDIIEKEKDNRKKRYEVIDTSE